jgi:uncharacterized membrane protein YhdT
MIILKNFTEKIFFLIGIFSTMQALIFSIGPVKLTLVNVLIFIFILAKITNNRFVLKINKYKMIILNLFIVFIISSILSRYFTNQEWSVKSINDAFKYVIILLPIIFIIQDKEIIQYRKFFFSGLLISAYCQLIWESFEIILWNFKNINLNEVVFGNMLKIQNANWGSIVSTDTGNFFRPSGISLDPSNLALALNIGFIQSDSSIMKLFFILGIILSGSRTGIIILFVNIVVDIVLKNNINLKKVNIKKVFVGFSLIILVLFVNFKSNGYFGDKLMSLISRVNIGYQQNDPSAVTHTSYYILLPVVLQKMNFIQYIFGYGTGIAG